MIKDEKSAKNIGGYLRKKKLLHAMKENPGLKDPPAQGRVKERF